MNVTAGTQKVEFSLTTSSAAHPSTHISSTAATMPSAVRIPGGRASTSTRAPDANSATTKPRAANRASRRSRGRRPMGGARSLPDAK